MGSALLQKEQEKNLHFEGCLNIYESFFFPNVYFYG